MGENTEMENAFYYREGYYLLPEEYADVEALKAAAKGKPLTLTVCQLIEDNKIQSNIQKGVCIAPYFYNEYGYREEDITIEDETDVFPVEAILLSQKEYNQRLREVILDYCPGCCKYKPISNRVQSLNGHFEEISLNSVCFYRQISKPSPRVFREKLWSFGGLAYHFDPADKDAADNLDFIKEIMYLKYLRGYRDSDTPVLHVEYKPDFFTEQLTLALSDYIEKHLEFTQFRISVPASSEDIRKQIAELLLPENRAAFQKNCKKYGVSIAFLKFDAAASEKMKRALSDLFYCDQARILYEEPGLLCLLVMHQCLFLKELHFRSPFMESCGSEIEIYDQYGISAYAVSFDMRQLCVNENRPH